MSTPLCHLAFARVCSLAAILCSGTAIAQLPVCWEEDFGRDLQLGDENMALAVPLGFPFPVPGGGTTNMIDVSPNGFVFLAPGPYPEPGCCHGQGSVLVHGRPRIAVAWMDLSARDGGGVHIRNAGDLATITWSGMAEPSNPSSQRRTAQLTLTRSGTFQLAYREMPVARHQLLVGFSVGGGTRDPGSIDLSASLPLVLPDATTVYETFPHDQQSDLERRTLVFIPTGNGYVVVDRLACTPAHVVSYGEGCGGLGLVADSAPRSGSSFRLRIVDEAVAARAAILLLGTSPDVFDLSELGAVGCRLLTVADFTLPTTTPTTAVLDLPHLPAAIGTRLFLQAAVHAPGVNPIGIGTTNGLEVTFGI